MCGIPRGIHAFVQQEFQEWGRAKGLIGTPDYAEEEQRV